MRVLAIRIYLGGYTGAAPMAELRMEDGVVENIEWTNIKQRKMFSFDEHTLFYDERPKHSWNSKRPTCNWNEIEPKSVTAVRIYMNCATGTPFVNLLLIDGTVVTINWTIAEQRKKFPINGYTLVYDERPKCEWGRWVMR